MRTQVVQQSEMLTLLTHELTHVTALAGKRDGAGRTGWWLIEGIAEYSTLIGKPVREFDAIGKGEEVPDPYYGGEKNFQEVFEILDRSTENFLKHIQHTMLQKF